MERRKARVGRILASASALILAAGGCASNKGDAAEGGERDEGRSASDTLYNPPTGDAGGTGTGGAGDTVPLDPTVTDTAGAYGDPNAWPTGPLPGDTGIGGAGSPLGDSVWMDTLTPADTFGIPSEPPGEEVPGGGTGPDVW